MSIAEHCGRRGLDASGAPGPRQVTFRFVAIELTDELIDLERLAWSEQQENQLTVETAARVEAAVTAHAKATEQRRYDVEMELKRVVRHADDDSDA